MTTIRKQWYAFLCLIFCCALGKTLYNIWKCISISNFEWLFLIVPSVYGAVVSMYWCKSKKKKNSNWAIESIVQNFSTHHIQQVQERTQVKNNKCPCFLSLAHLFIYFHLLLFLFSNFIWFSWFWFYSFGRTFPMLLPKIEQQQKKTVLRLKMIYWLTNGRVKERSAHTQYAGNQKSL